MKQLPRYRFPNPAVDLYRAPAADGYLRYALAASLLLHGVLFLLMVRRTSAPEPSENILEVSFVPDLQPVVPAEPPRQIVSPPDQIIQPESDAPARFLSDRDSTAAKEQIRRGDTPDAGPAPGRKQDFAAAVPKKPAAQPAQQQAKAAPAVQQPAKREQRTGPLKDLLLDDKTLLERYSPGSKAAAVKPADSANEARDNSPASEPFSRPAGSGAAFIGLRGSSDYLPNLPDGDITLLNTKADQYAVFVRRVATNVFAQIRLAGWETMLANDVRKIGDFSVVHAVLDSKGNLISVTLEGSSGSRRFDEVLKAAVTAGASDPNPPAAARSDDGNFHFLFKSKCWSQFTSSARTGALRERRWLHLATGLL